MQTRRRRPPQRRRSRSHNGGWLLLAVVLVGVAYFGAAGTAGTWLAKNVIQPVASTLGLFGEEKQTPAPSAQATPTGQGSVAVEMPAQTVYTLQTGVFSSSENASTESKNMQAKGGAGYVLQDGNNYRVLLSCYQQESEAKSVKERLAESMETKVYPITTQAGKAYVHTDAQATVLKEAQAMYEKARTALFEAAVLVEKPEEAKEKAKQARTQLQELQTKLDEIDQGASVFADALRMAVEGAMVDLGTAIDGTQAQCSAWIQHACIRLCIGYMAGLKG